MRAIVVPYDRPPYTIQSKEEAREIDYQPLKDMLTTIPHPFDWFEIVNVQVGHILVQMYLDEEGKMRNGWMERVNPIASMLYGNPNDVIVGDVVLFLDKHDGDTYLFDDAEADKILDILCDMVVRS